MEYYYSTKERTVCDVKIEIISFVVDGSVKLTIPPNDGQSTVVNLGKKQKWCSLWCRRSQVLPDTSGQDNFQIRVVYGHYTTRGVQFVPIGMATVCLRTFPAKTTKILPTRNSSILMMSASEYLFLE